MSQQPVIAQHHCIVPFDIAERDGLRVASNGRVSVTLLADDGRLFRRRGVKGFTGKPPGEAILPALNELAGDILAQPDMSAEQIAGRLAALATQAMPIKPQAIEWCVAELAGVRVYVEGESIVVTQRELMP